MHHLRRPHIVNALVAAIDPRIRLLAAALLLVLVVSSCSSLFPWLVAGICLPAALFFGMPLRVFCLRLLHPLFIAVVILVLKSLMGAGAASSSVTICGFTVAVHQAGLQEGMVIIARIMGAVSVAVLLSQVLTFTETMAGMAWLRVPRGLVDVSLFAWRSLFMLYDDAGVVFTAQRNRLGYSGLRRSLRSFGTMAGMLTIRAFDSSQSMTIAMSQRGYDGTLPILNGARPSMSQLAGLLAFSLVAAAVWKLQY